MFYYGHADTSKDDDESSDGIPDLFDTEFGAELAAKQQEEEEELVLLLSAVRDYTALVDHIIGRLTAYKNLLVRV